MKKRSIIDGTQHSRNMVTGYILLSFNNEKRSISEVLVTNRTVIHLFSVEIYRMLFFTRKSYFIQTLYHNFAFYVNITVQQ